MGLERPMGFRSNRERNDKGAAIPEEHPYSAIVGDVPMQAKESPKNKKEDDIYSMVTEGMEDALSPEKKEGDITVRDEKWTTAEAPEKENIIDYTQLLDHQPGLPGQDDLVAQEEALRPASLTRYGNLTPFERPSQREVPTPETQEKKRAELAALRAALVRIEQDEYAKVVGADTGVYYEAHQEALKEYDHARAEFIAGDIDRYSQEQFELMKKRGEGTPGKFGKWVANTDKFWRKHPIWKAGIGGALLGLGAFFAPALGVRSAFMGGAAFAGSHEKMRRLSLEGGMFGLIQGINKQSLKDLEQLGTKEMEERMAALAAYAKIQGYWNDVEGPYKKLQEAHTSKLKMSQARGVLTDVHKYASEQITKSGAAFDERLWKEDLKKQGRMAGAVGAGALAGGLLKWLWGTPPEQPPVPKPAGGAPLPSPGRVPDAMPERLGGEYEPRVSGDAPPIPTEAAQWVGTDVPANPPEPFEANYPEDVPVPKPYEPFEANYPEDTISSTPSPEVLQNIMEQIPAAHGLRPEYYDLIKDRPVTDFLGRKMFSTSLDNQYPFPKTDGEYPWIVQTSIAHNRMMDYSRLQDRMGAALAALKSDPSELEAAKKLPVSEFLKQIMGTSRSVGSRATSL